MESKRSACAPAVAVLLLLLLLVLMPDEVAAQHGGRHVGRRHGHQHRVGGADPYDTACCRRLMGIDNACICQAMSFLPQFMSRVKHSIKLTPVPGCDISFECAGVY
ncbi:hypothetical protein TRIUR3_17497 [Triticum urartu]|uniref:Bifunctional inhibitor/plant lipid transfer protein/seed storage helical domain-containing protein n=1 Tax=Triticum urartu TaxID=4572 RepID=M8A063_TRIUA|nr:hypothetical protein TRIUR3_17497 [Triticum urartu]